MYYGNSHVYLFFQCLFLILKPGKRKSEAQRIISKHTIFHIYQEEKSYFMKKMKQAKLLQHGSVAFLGYLKTKITKPCSSFFSSMSCFVSPKTVCLFYQHSTSWFMCTGLMRSSCSCTVSKARIYIYNYSLKN